jgi:hypothetical protein
MLATFFGAMALARLIMSLISSFSMPLVVIPLPRIPEVDALNLCATVIDFRFKAVPNSIGTAFGAWSRTSLLLACFLAYRLLVTLRVIRILRHRLVYVPQYDLSQVFRVGSHDRRGGHDIFSRYDRRPDIRSVVLESHAGVFFRFAPCSRDR